MAEYSVRIGKTSTFVYVRTPKGTVLRSDGQLPSRAAANDFARRVRKHLSAGNKLNPKRWVITRKATPTYACSLDGRYLYASFADGSVRRHHYSTSLLRKTTDRKIQRDQFDPKWWAIIRKA